MSSFRNQVNQAIKHICQAVPKLLILQILFLSFKFKRLIRLIFQGFFTFGTACCSQFKVILAKFFTQLMSKIEYLLWINIREIVAPISKEGIEVKEFHSEGFDGDVSAIDFHGNKRPEVFTPSTIIISSGYAVWELEVPKNIRKRLVDITLKIETVRTHGMLHSPCKGQSASISFNNRLVDQIYLVKPHPHGEDYGVDSRRPFPIFRYIDRNKYIQSIKVEVDKDVYWDIDRVTLEPIILRKEYRSEIAMIIGAIISAIIGGIVSFSI